MELMPAVEHLLAVVMLTIFEAFLVPAAVAGANISIYALLGAVDRCIPQHSISDEARSTNRERPCRRKEFSRVISEAKLKRDLQTDRVMRKSTLLLRPNPSFVGMPCLYSSLSIPEYT